MESRIHIIGIGSPFGDDRMGWVAAEALRRAPVLSDMPVDRLTISLLDRPGVQLATLWETDQDVILLDAIRSGAAPGTRHQFEGLEFPDPIRGYSSHGLGVVTAIRLARALGQLPVRLRVLGIEADPAWTGDSLSPAVRDALPSLVMEVVNEILIFRPSVGTAAGEDVSGRSG